MANEKSLREFKLSNLIQEVVTIALYEQTLVEQDPAPQMQPPQQNAGPVPPAPPAPPPEQTQQAPQGQAQPLTVDTMIERLNVVRGGKSFTDPEIYGQFTTFFKTLGPEQLQTIDQFLQDISRIVVSVDQQGGQSTETGMPPQQTPANNAGTQPPIGASPAATPPASPAGGMPGL